MGLAVLIFGIVVGVFHFQGEAALPNETEILASAPELPASYRQVAGRGSPRSAPAIETPAAAAPAAEGPATPGLEDLSHQDLAQAVADRVAANPPGAAGVITRALAAAGDDSTLGDVATLVAAATRAAPGQATAIAGAVTRHLRGQSDAALAASIATMISLVPEQSRDIGLVVGAILGDDVDALGMIAQTAAIATGEATFASLSESSGVSMARLMAASSGFGVSVPFDVPAYAAQLAPSPSQVAEGGASKEDAGGEM